VIRLPRTIRLDRSDAIVFAPAAEPGEWAVPGTFLFAGRDLDSLDRKERIAFRSGFLGVAGFGWSTLVTVTFARAEDRAEMVEGLARQFVARLGAPDLAAAKPAAEEEVEVAEDLCRGHAEGTLIALHREMDGDGIRERFRTLRPRADTAFGAGHLGGHDKAFHFVETDDQDDGGIDLRSLARGGDAR